MKKVLFCATVQSHICNFHLPYLRYFQERGCEVHVACKGDGSIPYCDVFHPIPFERSPFRKENIQAYRMLKQIIDEEDFSLIHCHTPMGSVLTRLAARKARKKGTVVFYTAHGFHFFKGAPMINWLIYYPTEWLLAFKTDVLITINDEDYQRAQKHMHAKKNVFMNGVGVTPIIHGDQIYLRQFYRDALNIDKDEIVLFFAGELNKNKNQKLLIEMCAKLDRNKDKIKLVLAGTGVYEKQYIAMAKEHHIEDHVLFLGWRNDIDKLLLATDIYVSASLREGLPVNIIEAMLAGLPVVATDVRGQRSLVVQDGTGFLVSEDVSEMAQAVELLMHNAPLRKIFGQNGKQRAEAYTLAYVLPVMEQLYEEYI